MDSRSAIREFVERILVQKGDKRPLDSHESLLLSGRLQSVDAVEIVVFMEEKWAIDFAEIGFDETLIDSIDAMDALVQRAGISI
jgi:hypothetical protein